MKDSNDDNDDGGGGGDNKSGNDTIMIQHCLQPNYIIYSLYLFQNNNTEGLLLNGYRKFFLG